MSDDVPQYENFWSDAPGLGACFSMATPRERSPALPAALFGETVPADAQAQAGASAAGGPESSGLPLATRHAVIVNKDELERKLRGLISTLHADHMETDDFMATCGTVVDVLKFLGEKAAMPEVSFSQQQHTDISSTTDAIYKSLSTLTRIVKAPLAAAGKRKTPEQHSSPPSGRGHNSNSRRAARETLPAFEMDKLGAIATTKKSNVEQAAVFNGVQENVKAIIEQHQDPHDRPPRVRTPLPCYSPPNDDGERVRKNQRTAWFIIWVYFIRRVIEPMATHYAEAGNIEGAYDDIRSFLQDIGKRHMIESVCTAMAKKLGCPIKDKKMLQNIFNGATHADLWLGNYCGFGSIGDLPAFSTYTDQDKKFVAYFLWFMWFKYGVTDARRKKAQTRMELKFERDVFSYKATLPGTMDANHVLDENKEVIEDDFNKIRELFRAHPVEFKF